MTIGRAIKFLALICALVALLSLVMTCAGNNGKQKPTTSQFEAQSILGTLMQGSVVAVHPWNVQEGEVTLECVFRSFTQDAHYPGPGIKLSVIDSSGKPVYEMSFTGLHRVYSVSALRGLSTQLVLEIDYGGSSSYMHLLDYRSGKVIELINEPEGEFDSGAEIRPQFRSGINPSAEPFQVMLIRGVGLASPAKKITTVLRYKEGRFQSVGELSQQEIDDYIEARLKRRP